MSERVGRLLHKVIALCKRRGFVFQSSVVQQGAYDYGPLGAELKRNLISEWWHAVVTSTGNVHALDCNTFASRSVLEMGTLDGVDHDVGLNQLSPEPQEDQESKLTSPLTNHLLSCRTNISQGAVLHFLECAKSLGLRLPFGIAEVGKVFRKETCPEYFLYRMREFEQMCLQFFCLPSENKEWYTHWQKKRLRWWRKFANHPESFLPTETARSELHELISQHSSIQFMFPWGSCDIESITNRGDSDLRRLSQVMEQSQSALKRAKSEDDKAFPFLISSLAGVDRAVLAYLCDAYTETTRPYGSNSNFRQGIILKLHTSLAPYKVAVLPTQEGNQKLCMYCRTLADELRYAGIRTEYSDVGSFEYRLAVQDEIGTPYRIIADDGTLESGVVTLQDRDTTAKEDMNGQDVLHSLQRMLLGARLN